MNIKAIIFDCFGVLSTEGFQVFCGKYFKDAPQKRKLAQQMMDQFSLGAATYEEFVSQLSLLSGASQHIVREYLSENKPNELLFNYIRQELKPTYKIGMLSNTGADWLSQLFSAQDLELFDDIVLSFKVGMTKPNPAIYVLAASRLEVDPKECILVDDIARYCEGAKVVGMLAILYEDFFQTKDKLDYLLKTTPNN